MSEKKASILNSGSLLLTNAQSYELDRLAIKSGITGEILMENAGTAVAAAIIERFTPCNTIILCGPGNNGGDGFVVARRLADKGWDVDVALLGTPDKLKGDAAIAAKKYNGKIIDLSLSAIAGKKLIVDALFGAGLARPIDGIAFEVLTAVKNSSVNVVAVDIPSGIDGDTGNILGIAAPAKLTVTFSAKKPGHLLLPGKEYCGEVVVAEIGHLKPLDPSLYSPQSLISAPYPLCFENSPQLWLDDFPWPSVSKHKYTRGHAVVVGGDIPMTGAARLAANASYAALRISAGLVTIACPVSATDVYAKTTTAVMIKPIKDLSEFKKFIADKKQAVLIGPGAGLNENTRKMALAILESSIPCVLDADAISVFKDNADSLFAAIKKSTAPVVMTPHSGEFKRIFGETNNDKLTATRNAAQKSGAIVLLKGSDMVIADPEGTAVINSNAPATLATAGSGDVLAGIITGLLASGMPPFKATCSAAWIHGQCANLFGLGLISEDLINMIPKVLEGLQNQSQNNFYG